MSKQGTIGDLERIHATRVIKPAVRGGAVWMQHGEHVELSLKDYATLHQLALDGVVASTVRCIDEDAAAAAPSHRPSYYDAPNGVTYERIVNGFGLGPWEADVLKYILRAGKKGPALADLNKARESIDNAIRAESDWPRSSTASLLETRGDPDRGRGRQ